MKRKNRLLSLFLAGTLLLPAAAPAVQAQDAPSWAVPVSADESVYVNLDYYGAVSSASIVKGLNLNGNRRFMDYGSYSKVSNMSGYEQPQITPDGIEWNLPENAADRFYYECGLQNDSIILPWDFQVSYLLNGVPTPADRLAGASGLVEMNVECIPNENAAPYYRNNMLLQMASLVNMDDVLSVDAPGSQTQAVGAYKAIIFAALPGEHTTFTVRIGTEHFSSMGMIMLMIPGTLSQMQMLKELKETKNLLGDSAMSLFAGFDEVLGTVNGLSGSLGQTQAGFRAIQEALSGLSGAGGALDERVTEMINNLSGFADQILPIFAPLQDSQKLVNDLNGAVSTAVSGINDLSGMLRSLKVNITALQGILEMIRAGVVNGDLAGQLQESLGQLGGLQESISGLMDRLQGIGTESPFDALVTQAQALQARLDELSANYGDIPGAGESIAALRDSFGAYVETLKKTQETYDAFTKELPALISDLGQLDQTLGDISGTLGGLVTEEDIEKLLTQLINMMDSINKAIDQSRDFLKKVAALEDKVRPLIEKGGELMSGMAKLGENLSAAIGKMAGVLQGIQKSVSDFSQKLGGGTQDLLGGLSEALSRVTKGLGSTGHLQDAGASLQKSLDQILNKYTSGNNMLEIDPSTPLVSFTSGKNPTPKSIQVILRTQEIGLGSEEADLSINGKEAGSSPWERIAAIFKKIWKAIVSIFE